MAVSREAVTQPTAKSNGSMPKVTAVTPARGTRGDGSGSMTPNDRTKRRGNGSPPNRRGR